MGHQPGFEYQGKEIKSSYKLRLTYELPNSLMDDGRPHWVSEEITNSDNDKSALYARVNALKGDFNNLTAMIGSPCTVHLVPGKPGYVKINGKAGISGVPNGVTVGELANPTFTFDLENPDMTVFEGFPEFIQDRIKGNLDYEGSALEERIENPNF